MFVYKALVSTGASRIIESFSKIGILLVQKLYLKKQKKSKKKQTNSHHRISLKTDLGQETELFFFWPSLYFHFPNPHTSRTLWTAPYQPIL